MDKKRIHGGDIYSRPIRYDFSANINPLGMPKAVKKILIEQMEAFEHYPDIDCTALRHAIADYEQADASQVVCGNGAADLIYRVVQVLQPKQALLIAPTFSEYERALRKNGCAIEYYELSESQNFAVETSLLERLHGKDILFLCSPNNPVGNIIPQDVLKRIQERCVQEHVYMVLDACFYGFVPEEKAYPLPVGAENVLLLKAFTKMFAMAGLRLGYLLCGDAALVREIADCGPCWSVSVPAQLAGVAALKHAGSYVKETVTYVSKEREYLAERLSAMGLQVYPSVCNFLLFKSSKTDWESHLLEENIAIRSCAEYRGLGTEYFRIAVRTHEENVQLTETMERILKHG